MEAHKAKPDEAFDADFFWPRDARSRLALVALALAVFFYLSLYQTALIDDAFITLRYAKTLFENGTWGFYPAHGSNTATSPLNVLLLTAFSFVTRSPLRSVLWLSATEFMLMALFLRGIGKVLHLPFFAPLAFAGLICNPLLMSTLGLESTLFATLLVAALYFYLAQRYELMALVCGLLTLTRPDGILFFAICFIAMPRNFHHRIRIAACYGMCIAPWYLFSWIALGSIVPDTLALKMSQVWGRYAFGKGLILYFRKFPIAICLSFLFAPLATLAFYRSVRALGSCIYLLAAYGALYYAAYALLGVPPYHWYYVPVVLCVVILGALAVAQLARTSATTSWLSWRTLAISQIGIAIISVAALFVREGLPMRESWIGTNWATQTQYRSIGEWLAANHAGETGRSDGEIGTIAYYCDCLLVDPFSERKWLDVQVERAQTESDWRDLIARANYAFYRPQVPFDDPGYMVTYLAKFGEYVRRGQIWHVDTRWRGDGVIIFNSFQPR